MANEREMEVTLKSCPFEHPVDYGVTATGSAGCYYVYCADCGASSSSQPTEDEAVSVWDSRRPNSSDYNAGLEAAAKTVQGWFECDCDAGYVADARHITENLHAVDCKVVTGRLISNTLLALKKGDSNGSGK